MDKRTPRKSMPASKASPRPSARDMDVVVMQTTGDQTSTVLSERRFAAPRRAEAAALLRSQGAERREKHTEAATPEPVCFYSSAVGGDLSRLLGVPHYSYRFAESKFLRIFADHDRPLISIPMPEYHNTLGSFPPPGVSRGQVPVHLIFRSTEQIRLVKLAYNVACFAWEFEVLKDFTLPGEHPFLNQCRMLSICDEIWVPCGFTRDVLAAHGLGNVHVIPAPIKVPVRPRLERNDALTVIGHVGVMPLVYNFLRTHDENARACVARSRSLLDWLSARRIGERDPAVYLAVLNPEDFRKNLDAMIRGFHHFQAVHREACLIVKVLTSADRFSLERVVSDVVPNKLASGSMFDTDNIVFTNRFLSDEEMEALFCLADYYLCTSRAEGQNLPLLEAMAHGTVPVSTANTAMADYIDDSCAFVIEERRVPQMTPHLAGSVSGKPFHIHDSSSRDVFAALVRSAKSPRSRWRAKSDAARAVVAAKFAAETVWPRIEQRLRAAAARRAEA